MKLSNASRDGLDGRDEIVIADDKESVEGIEGDEEVNDEATAEPLLLGKEVGREVVEGRGRAIRGSKEEELSIPFSWGWEDPSGRQVGTRQRRGNKKDNSPKEDPSHTVTAFTFIGTSPIFTHRQRRSHSKRNQ